MGVRFPDEYRRKIEASQLFCLLDSGPARRSEHVREECRIARERSARHLLDFVVCRAAVIPESDRAHELFEDHHETAAIDLVDYETGVRKLFRHWGLVYVPGFDLPSDRDFVNEVHAAKLPPEEIQALVDMYESFRELYGVDPEVAEAQLRVLSRRLDREETRTVVSHRIALGVVEGERGHHPAASRTFEALVERKPDDPRGWAGLGGARYYAGDHQGALEAYRQALALLAGPAGANRPGETAHTIHNLARVLAVLGRTEEARGEILRLPADQQEEPYIQALLGRILLQRRRWRGALAHLERAFDAYRERQRTPPPHDLITDLADCHCGLGRVGKEREVLLTGTRRLPGNAEVWRRLADSHLREGAWQAALGALERAVELAPGHVRYRAELASVLQAMGLQERARREAERCVVPERRSAAEHYYLGLAHFVLGHHDLAAFEEELGRRDPVVRSWPPYETLTSGDA